MVIASEMCEVKFTTKKVKIHAKADEVELIKPMVCGGVISVMMIQQIGPTPNENELTNAQTQMIGNIDELFDNGRIVVDSKVVLKSTDLIVVVEVELISGFLY
ncbi:hypothetical protein RDWZM_002697 [Blomia tropicalis]|uniref:Uncharacterized protein n=1 Tax=Blomia tropicalis TaxID=40697 RepID=A0A9Q0MEE8_BLOTA|nr:hypothetical protein RDWZM_002697 [Blomia tropicalis]